MESIQANSTQDNPLKRSIKNITKEEIQRLEGLDLEERARRQPSIIPKLTQEQKLYLKAITERRICELMLSGLTARQIASKLKVTQTNVERVIRGQIEQYRRRTKALAPVMREIEGARYDSLISAIWDRALGGDIPAIKTVVKISEEKRKLYGLDAPIRITTNDDELEVDASKLENLDKAELLELRRLAEKAKSKKKDKVIDASLDPEHKQD